MGSPELLAIAVVVFGFVGIALFKAIGRGIQWIASEVADHVVRAIGDTLSVRWNADMAEALKPIKYQLTINGGDSLRDAVDSSREAIDEINDRVVDIERQLEQEFNWQPRRRRHFDEDDAYPA